MTARAKTVGVVETIFEDREGWLNGRLGNIGGSSLKDVVNLRDGKTKAGIWRIAAESIIGSAAIAEDDLTSAQILARGHELEVQAIRRFEEATGKKARKGLVIWSREDDKRMTVSPDAPLGKGMTEAFEAKCLLSPKHLEALYTRSIPDNTAGYDEQKLQYFIANPKLKTLYWGFFHPDFPAGLDFLYLTFTREELAADIERYLELERDATAKIREIVNAVTLYSPAEVAKINAVKEELLATSKEEQKAGLDRVYKTIMDNQHSV